MTRKYYLEYIKLVVDLTRTEHANHVLNSIIMFGEIFKSIATSLKIKLIIKINLDTLYIH